MLSPLLSLLCSRAENHCLGRGLSNLSEPQNHLQGLLKHGPLGPTTEQWVWGGSQDFVLLASSLGMLRLQGPGQHFENHWNRSYRMTALSRPRRRGGGGVEVAAGS